MNSEIQKRFNSEWGCNNLFPYTEVIDRHFKMLDELEKRTPRHHPVLWKGNPNELDSFLRLEEEARELRRGAVDRLYEDLRQKFDDHLPREFTFTVTPIDPNNFWGNPVDEPQQPQQEVKIEENEPVVENDNLDRYFNNASPIPHFFTNLNDRNCMGEDYLSGIPLVETSPPSTESSVNEVEEYSQIELHDNNGLVSDTPTEKKAKRQEAILRRKMAYKKKKMENKLNNAFIILDNRHSREYYNSNIKTDHPFINLKNCFSACDQI